MNEFDRAGAFKRYWLWFALAATIPLSLQGINADLGKLLDADGILNAGAILSGFLSPDFSKDFLVRVLELSFESLLIGVLGTVFAVLVGVFFAFFAIRIPGLDHPPKAPPLALSTWETTSRSVARFCLGFFRSIPEIVWAYLFVQILGLGPGPAVFAIALTVGGSIGKLYAELAESIEPKTIQAMRATGASRWAILLFAVLPQVGRQWVAYALFRLECNIRSGTILGVVGAGGLGSEIALSIRYFQFDKLATTLFAVLLFVILLEIVSAKLRKSEFKWTFGFAAVGTAAAVLWLDIPWKDVIAPGGVPMLSLTNLVIEPAFISKTVVQIGETLLMAWAATAISAIFAFVLCPLAAAQLTTGSYLPDPLRPPTLTIQLQRMVKWGSRLFLQVTRAMPELTLALVFVVWVGGGALAGILAIAVHNIGVMGRLYSDVLEEVEPGPAAALQTQGASSFATFLFGVLPQIKPRLAAFTLYRFEVNVRATVMVGFVGAGGFGDALYTAISLFHMQDLTLLLMTMLIVVSAVDAVGDYIRTRILKGQHTSSNQEFVEAAAGKTVEVLQVESEFIGVKVGSVTHPIHAFLDVSEDGFVVLVSESLPEDLCLELSVAMPVAHGTPRFTVTPHLLGTQADANGVVSYRYRLSVCDPSQREPAGNYLSDEFDWHLATAEQDRHNVPA
ncbi:MAG: ABC transporter permease subunit [Telluria sp.]